MTIWDDLMDRALVLARNPQAPRGENPRVGCVIADAQGRIIGEGWHAGAGTDHAEVVALRHAGDRAQQATAIVTLEPCNHRGKTGPCTQALIQAGITRVIFAQQDPTARAGGGGIALQEAGIEVVSGVRANEAQSINREWSIAVRRGYPFVTAKCAISLDGRVTDREGKKVSLTGQVADQYTHELRSRCQAVVVGTQTVMSDDPQLTVRHAPILAGGQPMRVVVGKRSLPSSAQVFDSIAPSMQIATHDPMEVLVELFDKGVRHVLVEGGPTLLRSFVEAQLIDEFVWLIAGVWIGSGKRALSEGVQLDYRLPVIETATLDQDVAIRLGGKAA
jgi:diaminohydroxyphosphoribosylaminopyrimidine deaminase/5-amino-6-(5-phosphoribosylamino)uracil reductase